jgi:hypothetical protein
VTRTATSCVLTATLDMLWFIALEMAVYVCLAVLVWRLAVRKDRRTLDPSG